MIKTLSAYLLCMVLTAISLPVLASFTGVPSVSVQGSSNLRDNQASRVSLLWQGASDSSANNNFGNPYEVFSTTGTFSDAAGNFSISNESRVADSLVIGTVNAFSIRELLQVPRSVLFNAQQYGSNQIIYSRVFTDGSDNDVSRVVTVTFDITNAGDGQLSLSQVDLRFGDNTLSKVITLNQPLSAKAEISHSGVGVFSDDWEIATPASTRGTPVFTRLSRVRQVFSGNQTSLIESPLLPTGQVGTYLLRLNIQSPDTQSSDMGFNTLQLQYTVIDEQGGNVIEPIALQAPGANSRVNGQTRFQWQPVEKAHVYRLEIIELKTIDLPQLGEPVLSMDDAYELSAGILLAREQTDAQLSKIVMERIQPGRSYLWQVLAFDQQGNIVGKSDTRRIWFKP